ncbi:hypothetical protein Pint_10055 [Pistacia integerrima]|uniref:Uncharacterized protein n=1 Tax=Pistacia integerrima TaxID=434235 RepID=A0ACC0XKG9_9ROSI|nr:hypothetical protein Pint_10055 [Pistacia integerrima]
MEEAQEAQLHIMVEEAKEPNSDLNTNMTNQSTVPQQINYKWWLRIALYILIVLVGQTVALLLGRLYYVKGGTSKWVGTLMQVAGFPVLLFFYCFSAFKNSTANNLQTQPRFSFIIVSAYALIGLITAANCFLLSTGMLYLPVSTYTLISASQLGFNALFSFFLNSQKFTPLIINSLVLLTISSILLMFQNGSGDLSGVSKVKFAIGFICTLGGSAGCGLNLSLTQLCFRKVFKRGTFMEIIDVIFYNSMVATGASLVGLFASGEWKSLSKEMELYELGKVAYVMTIVWAAIAWQVFTVALVELMVEVSSLFCNSISVLGFPVVPALAVVFFHDKMDGVKVISMVLAIWGIISYIYQQYLDESKSETDPRMANEVSEAFPSGIQIVDRD